MLQHKVMRPSHIARLMNVPVVVTFVLTIILALSLDDQPLPPGTVKAIVASIADLVPSIENYTNVSKFPHVTRVVFVVVWLLTPLCTVFYSYLLLVMPPSMMRLDLWRRRRVLMTIAATLVLPSFVAICYFKLGMTDFPEVGGETVQHISRAMAQSRAMLAVGATAMSIFVSFTVALFIFWVQLLPTLFLERPAPTEPKKIANSN